jgi:hypothetical protein
MDIVIWRCPKCTTEVHQHCFGTSHTTAISCVDCDIDMDVISKGESAYEFENKL